MGRTIIRLINKYKNNPSTFIFFLIGNFIAIFTISIGISSIEQMKILASEKNDGIPTNTRQISVNLNKKIKKEDIVKVIDKIPNYCSAKIINNYTYIDGADKRIGHPMIILANDKNIEEEIPVYKGNFISKDNKEVLIGLDLEKFCYESDGKKKIDIYGENYDVVGIMGYKNKDSKWSNRIVLNFKYTPNKNMSQIESGSFIVQIESDRNDIDIISEKFQKEISEYGVNPTINIEQISYKDETYSNILGSNSFLFKMILMVYVFSIINLIFISVKWIETIYNEVGIMKACGMSNFFIIRRIFIEMFIISLISTILAILIQYFISEIIKEIDTLYFYISSKNIIIAIVVSIITTIVTLIGPIIRIMRETPIKLLKN